MLISFTGAQSSGKTTLLNHWTDCRNHFKVVPEVTRKLKRQGFEINDDSNNYIDTQIAILADHLNNIFLYSNTETTGIVVDTILDRCIIDGFIYTRYFRKEGKVDEFVDKVFTYMLKRYIEKYDYIFYTSPYDVALINDGERSMSESFRNKIIKLYEELILDKYPNVYVLEGSVESRYNKMIEIIYNE
jgi:nicotinamide riboside kinase